MKTKACYTYQPSKEHHNSIKKVHIGSFHPRSVKIPSQIKRCRSNEGMISQYVYTY